MTKPYDDLEYLVDRNEIAFLLGVGPTAVSNYVAQTNDKHPEFPDAAITRSLGRFRLWNLIDVMNWHSAAFPKRDVNWDMRRLRSYRKAQA